MTGKLALWIALMIALPTALLARDLHAVAKRERARRQRLRLISNDPVRRYDDHDLRRVHDSRDELRIISSASGENGPKSATTRRQRKDEAHRRKQEEFWRHQRQRHDQDQLRLTTKIRRLEWRLKRRREELRQASQRLSGRDDPALRVIESSLEALRSEFRKREEAFLERGRRGGALPGWLR